MDEKEIKKKIEYLFDRYWDEDLTDEEQEKLDQDSKDLVVGYSWKEVYSAATEYLHSKCKTPESVINFASNYWTYGWYDYPIPNPHSFLAYFYFRINYETEKYDTMDILDSLATTILPKAGYTEADLVLNPYYMPENDPKIQSEVNKFKNIYRL